VLPRLLGDFPRLGRAFPRFRRPRSSPRLIPPPARLSVPPARRTLPLARATFFLRGSSARSRGSDGRCCGGSHSPKGMRPSNCRFVLASVPNARGMRERSAKYGALFHHHGLATRDGDEAQSADHGAASMGGLTSPYACPCPCPYTKFREIVYGHGHGHVYGGVSSVISSSAPSAHGNPRGPGVRRGRRATR
jgi:hypothetical protein